MKIVLRVVLTMVLLLAFVTSCKQLEDFQETDTAAIMVKIAAREIACELTRNSDWEKIRAVEGWYELIKAGNVTPELLASLPLEDRPTLVSSAVDLLSIVAGNLTADNYVSPNILKAIAEGWRQGKEMCGLQKEDYVR